MKTIGRTMLAVVIGLLVGCDFEVYRNHEGFGVTGPNGGFFVCDNDAHCPGTPW